MSPRKLYRFANFFTDSQNKTWYGNASVELRQQIKLSLSYSNGFYRPVGKNRGEWFDHMNHDRIWTAGLDFNTRSSVYGYGASYSWGELGGSTYGYLAPYLWLRPTKQTFLNVSTERLKSFGNFDQTVVSGGWDITNQDGVVFRYILANSHNYFRFAYNRQVRKGIDIFAVYDKDPSLPAQFSVKLVFALPFSFSNLSQSTTSASAQKSSFFDTVMESLRDSLGFTGNNSVASPIGKGGSPGILPAAASAESPEEKQSKPEISGDRVINEEKLLAPREEISDEEPPQPTPEMEEAKGHDLDAVDDQITLAIVNAFLKKENGSSEITEARTLATQTFPAEAKSHGTAAGLGSTSSEAAVAAKSAVVSKAFNTQAPAEKKWSVQVKAYSKKDDSLKLAQELRKKGYDSYAEEAVVKGTTWHRVRVGQLLTRNEAETLKKILTFKESLTDVYVVAH